MLYTWFGVNGSCMMVLISMCVPSQNNKIFEEHVCYSMTMRDEWKCIAKGRPKCYCCNKIEKFRFLNYRRAYFIQKLEENKFDQFVLKFAIETEQSMWRNDIHQQLTKFKWLEILVRAVFKFQVWTLYMNQNSILAFFVHMYCICLTHDSYFLM